MNLLTHVDNTNLFNWITLYPYACGYFETANFAQSSVCSVGLVIVKDGEIVDNYYSLIRPIPNY